MNKLLIIKIIEKKLLQGSSEVFVYGNSMFPTLVDGQKVKVTNVSENQLKKNDIVLAKVYSDHFVIHRIVEIVEIKELKWAITKGDNNSSDDGYFIPLNRILGVVYDE